MAKDPEPSWAVVGKDLPRALVEELVERARAEEDKAESMAARRTSWRQWCLAQTEGGLRALLRWIREGTSGLQSMGILVQPGGFYAGRMLCWPPARRLGGRCGGTRRPFRHAASAG